MLKFAVVHRHQIDLYFSSRDLNIDEITDFDEIITKSYIFKVKNMDLNTKRKKNSIKI